MKHKGFFIAFEGIDGSGKSTQVQRLADHLDKKGHKVYTTCEPTDSPIGKIIRDIFNHRMEGDQKVIAALFAADRLNHLLHSKDGILQKMNEGYTVITDRYYLSSYAYHSVHGIDLEWVIQANALSAQLLRPDINIYIDVLPKLSLERLSARKIDIEMYETMENLTRVYNQYQIVFDRIRDDEKIVEIDGSRQQDEVHKDIIDAVSAL